MSNATADKVKSDLVKVSMLRAYLLALFSHFVAKLVGDLYLSLHGPEAMRELFDTENKVVLDGDAEPAEESADDEEPARVEKETPPRRKKFKEITSKRKDLWAEGEKGCYGGDVRRGEGKRGDSR